MIFSTIPYVFFSLVLPFDAIMLAAPKFASFCQLSPPLHVSPPLAFVGTSAPDSGIYSVGFKVVDGFARVQTT
jgi:hypothetical protein